MLRRLQRTHVMYRFFDSVLVFFATLYVDRHVEHRCHGGHCHVCRHIHLCMELVAGICGKAAIPVLLSHKKNLVLFIKRLRQIFPSPRTLVSQKVLLLD